MTIDNNGLPELKSRLPMPVVKPPAQQHQGEPVALPERKEPTQHWVEPGGVHKAEGWNACLDEIAKLGPLYTHADHASLQRSWQAGYDTAWYAKNPAEKRTSVNSYDPAEVERLLAERKRMDAALVACSNERDTLRADIETMRRKNNEYWHETEALRAQLAEVHALLRGKSGDLIRMAAHLISAPLFALQDLRDEEKKMTRARVAHAVDVADARLKDAAYELRRIADALSASAEPSAPKCKGWTCFHCDEHFTDSEAAAIHFGTHEIQRPVCLIDAAEYRSMEARVRECANEDSELHRLMHRQVNEHKLELRRAEEDGYAKGLADASAPVEIDEQAAFMAWANEEYGVGEGEELNLKNPSVLENKVGWMARSALERKS